MSIKGCGTGFFETPDDEGPSRFFVFYCAIDVRMVANDGYCVVFLKVNWGVGRG